MDAQTRHKIKKALGLLLTLVAFGYSYSHTQEWIADHGPDGWVSYVAAALPEVMVVVAVLSLPEGRRDPRVWLMGGSAVAFTLWANGAKAEHGLSGLVVALWPAWAALMGVWLVGHGPADDPAPVVHVEPVTQPRPKPVTRVKPPVTQPVDRAKLDQPVGHDPIVPDRVVRELGPKVAAALTQDRPTVTQKVTQPAGSEDKLAQAVRWATDYQTEHGTVPSRPQIVAGADVSDSTAKRARARLATLATANQKETP